MFMKSLISTALIFFTTLASADIKVGIEYILIDIPAWTPKTARAFSEMGARAAKAYPEHIQWGAMQSAANAPINFARLDDFVRQYQGMGFTDLMVALKSNSTWGSKNVSALRVVDPTPKPQYYPQYDAWIQAVVERYDGDGNQDMPGLRYPLRYIEIGSEFSTYEPEPIANYLELQRHAYAAAKRASAQVQVGHAAFIPTTAFKNNPGPGQYEAAFAAVSPRIAVHSLNDIRAVLNQGNSFDFINVHNLGDPLEIEQIVRWINYELQSRNYRKPIVISDTFITPLTGWGPSDTCVGNPNNLGLLVPPAVEADRCRIANFFNNLLNNNQAAMDWTRGTAGEDNVRRTFIAAQQGIPWINLSYLADLPFLTTRGLHAGAGLAAWAGLVRLGLADVAEKYPNYYALKQMFSHFNGTGAVTRVPFPDDKARVYKFRRQNQDAWVAWVEPKRVVLPGEPIPTLNINLNVGGGLRQVNVEKVINRRGQTNPDRSTMPVNNSVVTMQISTTPVYIYR